jgi:hypothetical protein
VLITTPGASNANSYADLTEAAAYCAENPYASGWFNASSGDQAAALITATKIEDANPFAWTGEASTDVQALGWPRKNMKNRNGFPIADNIIPQALKESTIEEARALLAEDRLGDNSVVNKGIASLSAGPVSISYTQRRTMFGAQEIPELAKEDVSWLFLSDYARSLLVPSWLKLTPAQQALQNKLSILMENL